MDVRERIWITMRMLEEIFHTVNSASFKQQLTMDFRMLYCILKAEERVGVSVSLYCLITGNTWMVLGILILLAYAWI